MTTRSGAPPTPAAPPAPTPVRAGFRAGIRGLTRACHPEPTVAVTAVATALAVAVGRGVAGALAVAAAVLAGQLSVGWHNDYLDRDRDTDAARRDKPVAHGALGARAVGVAAGCAGLATVPLSLLSGPVPGLLHVAAVASAWTYNLRLKSTPVSVLPYAVSFGLLPAFVVAGGAGHPVPPVWLVAAGALLGSGAHFANVLPDLADDLRAGVRGLPHRLGAPTSRIAAAGLLVAASTVVAFGPPAGPGLAGAVTVAASVVIASGGLWFGRRPGSRAAFLAALVLAAVDVALLLTAGHGIT
ncbi:MAG TPA: UbiA family prenyltransferase [Mycobacteriales bacterium]|nr:UbiA family prenyltransferase [Mycobacteriales bacterium]